MHKIVQTLDKHIKIKTTSTGYPDCLALAVALKVRNNLDTFYLKAK